MYRKRELVERSELILPWRPFYRLVSDSVYSRHERHGLELLPPYAVEFSPIYFTVLIPGFPHLPERPGYWESQTIVFVKFPGPGKSCKMSLVL